MGKKKLLFILGSMDIGGVQSGIMNFAKLIDPEEIHIDVLVHTKTIGFHEEAFKEYGEVYHLPLRLGAHKYLWPLFYVCDNIFFYKDLKLFLSKHHYDIVHSKALGLSAVAVKAAKKEGVPIRIAQCHVDKPNHLNIYSRLCYRIGARIIEKNATCKLAVSPKAADLMFCKFGGRVIKNPTISLERFNPSKYSVMPHEGINIIQVGTFSHRKNQCFSVCVLNEILKHGVAAKLTFVGYSLDEPAYIDEIKQTVDEYGLNKNVEFLPKDSDIPLLLAESDYMLIPSLREGLPNVALEAQAMGVFCFISDTVYQGTNSGLCEFLSLDEGPKKWAEFIIAYREKHGSDKQYIDMSEWDNKTVVKEYIKIWNGEK
ncbi:MAG: glycosyltransferase [Lachnospiraceae bacterium]|nr:glycosyltransferase [Lachnospiraceae bacterium]